MKKIKSVFFGVCVCILFSCKKEITIKGTRDLKNLSLSELKKFLNGHWRLHRAEIGTIAGVNNIIIPDSVRVYLIFFPVDSIRRENTINNIVIREKLVYEWLQLPLGANSTYAYVLMFNRDIYGYRNNWVADRLVNDTLIFENYFKSEGGDRYYYTKEP
ncbi:MAG: hypothetical protein K2Q24_01360 [Chitinophagaceae bacterium]|nr:hypothetical protein [Chitinophagaceae bacterium]